MNVCWKNRASLNPGQHQSQPQDRLGLRQALCLRATSYLGLLYQRSEHTSEEALCGCWKNGSLASVDGLTCPQAHTCCQGTCRLCVCGQWCKEVMHTRLHVWIWSLTFCSFKSQFFLYNVIPQSQSTARQCARWAVWPLLSLEELMLCNVFCSWFLFFLVWILKFFPPLLPSTDAPIFSLYIFALLDIILPITSQNSNHHMSCGETKLRDTVRNGNSKENVNFLQSAQRAVFFPAGGRLGWCQTWGPMSLNVLKPAWVNLKMHWIPYKEALKYQCQPISVHLQSRVIGIFGVCSC